MHFKDKDNDTGTPGYRDRNIRYIRGERCFLPETRTVVEQSAKMVTPDVGADCTCVL